MKKLYLLLLLLLPFLAQSQDLSKLDERFGFRDVRLESDFSSFKNLVPQESPAYFKIYTRTTDKLIIGDFKLKDITYSFHKGKLAFIMIRTEGIINSRGLFKTLAAEYGEPVKKNDYQEIYFWKGEKALMSYEEKPGSYDAKIMIFSHAMLIKIDDSQKEAGKKATSDL